MATVALLVFAGRVALGQFLPSATLPDFGPGLALFSGFATVCAATAGRRFRGPQRAAWWSLSVGLGGMVVGDVIAAYAKLTTGQLPPFPSPHDMLYLLLPVSLVATAVFAPLSGVRSGIRLILDGVIVSASLFIVAWSVVLHEVYHADRDALFGFYVAVAFPVADLALLTMLLLIRSKAPPIARRALNLLCAGLLVVALVNGAVVVWDLRPPLDDGWVVLGWAFGMYLVGAAGLTSTQWMPLKSGALPEPTRRHPWLPYVPVPFAIVYGIIDVWPLHSIAPIVAGTVILIVAAMVRQLTLLDENKRLRVTVADIALRDPLTGLGNRTLFTDRLGHAMALRVRNATPVAVLMLDLDDFKLVNDSLGHSAGDVLLCSVGERIGDCLRTGDTLARLGGDEFAILVEDSPEIANEIADCIVRAFDEPFVVLHQTVYMQVSIGLASAGATGDLDVSAEELFRRADLAMYSAKRDHATGARAFTQDMRSDVELHLATPDETGQPDRVARIQLLGDLRRAIDERELDLVYQPKFDLHTGLAVGVEALLRWPHPEFGTLEPADFLPLVRENGLMEAVTELVISRAAEDAASWYADGIELPVAINLSAPSLNDQGLPGRILSVLAAHDLPTRALAAEITEDVLLASLDEARTVLNHLRDAGIRVAIDDFGSGYATMTYLHELPIDELKLDRQFIAPILHDERAAAIVRSVIELATTFGLDSVAEGVENLATAERLKEYGCRFGQGHYFSRPVPAQAIRLGVWGATSAASSGVTPAVTRPSWA